MRTHRLLTAPRAAILAGLIAAGLAGLTGTPADAQNRIMCSQPVKPTCVASDLTYEDKQRIDRCRRDVENYSQSVEQYLSCLKQKANEQEEALKELQKQFRCSADEDVEC